MSPNLEFTSSTSTLKTVPWKRFFCSLLIVLFFKSTAFALDELIGARCQSKCLRDYELRVKNQTDLRRQLKHEILSLCQSDANCSSCMLPCKEQFESDQRCSLTMCKNSSNSRSCEDSCVFVEKISRRKPGQCPSPPKDLVVSECSAICNRDADCREAERCCTSGCSRTCQQPIFANDQRLLPIPEAISVQERKRKRSAIVRWIMKRMSPQHTATNSNLYVIQWRWGVQKDAETMTPWQTIVVKNKMYAILKHLLSPGRFYIFRVASVNIHGTAGFSQPSHPFKLTKEVRAPGAPLNLTVESEKFVSNAWTVNVVWTPPTSELPIHDYVLSYWQSSLNGIELYEKQVGQKAALVQTATDDDESDEADDSTGNVGSQLSSGNANGNPERRSTILPSYSTHATLSDSLEPNSVYVVELFANVDSTEGELRGESAILVIRTRQSPTDQQQSEVTLPPWPAGSFYDTPDSSIGIEKKQLVSSTSSGTPRPIRLPIEEFELPNRSRQSATTDESNASDDSTLFQADLQIPYLDSNHVIQSTLSWLDHPKCSSQKRDFDVRLESVRCSRPLNAELLVSQCVASLEKLHFACDYKVEVRDTKDRQLITRLAFTVPTCTLIPTSDPIDCRDYQERPTVRCTPLLTSDTQNAVECEWTALDAIGMITENEKQNDGAVVGYRVVLNSSHEPRTNVTIVTSTIRSLRYDRLTDGADYRLKVQALTTNGLGREVETEFRTGAAGAYVEVFQRSDANKRTDSLFGGATFTSSAATIFTEMTIKFVVLFLLLRLFVAFGESGLSVSVIESLTEL
ncbi:hypothetical protein M3Y98_00834000 [Aphelenchoides besseyi]|nr:hypothetical protein M3Y98_00834000 [Aphelenchoides besseyi]KAI6195446.1 hypothetical protein M3Y96_01232300 [Aphelenchoides besseyi]